MLNFSLIFYFVAIYCDFGRFSVLAFLVYLVMLFLDIARKQRTTLSTLKGYDLLFLMLFTGQVLVGAIYTHLPKGHNLSANFLTFAVLMIILARIQTPQARDHSGQFQGLIIVGIGSAVLSIVQVAFGEAFNPIIYLKPEFIQTVQGQMLTTGNFSGFGIFPSRTTNGLFLVFVLNALFARLLLGHGKMMINAIWASIVMAGLFASFSRTPLIAALVSIILCFLVYSKGGAAGSRIRVFHVLPLVVLISCLVWLLLDHWGIASIVRDAIASRLEVADFDYYARNYIWRNALSKLDSPLSFVWGLGTGGSVFRYEAHSAYVELIVEFGVLGVLLYTGFLVFTIRAAFTAFVIGIVKSNERNAFGVYLCWIAALFVNGLTAGSFRMGDVIQALPLIMLTKTQPVIDFLSSSSTAENPKI